VYSLFDAPRYIKGTGPLADVNLVATPENGCSIQASFFYVQVSPKVLGLFVRHALDCMVDVWCKAWGVMPGSVQLLLCPGGLP
jgi:hypothetical protein